VTSLSTEFDKELLSGVGRVDRQECREFRIEHLRGVDTWLTSPSSRSANVVLFLRDLILVILENSANTRGYATDDHAFRIWAHC
jgi:hypothetical protein